MSDLARIERQTGWGMITIKTDLSDAKFASGIKKVIGSEPPNPLSTVRTEEALGLWMAPDEVMVMCPAANVAPLLSRLVDALEDAGALIADMSDARAVFDVKGPGLRDVLSKLTPADMSPAAFTPGRVRRTRFAQAAAAVVLLDEAAARIVCFRSVADYVEELLRNAADPAARVDHYATAEASSSV